MRSRTPFSLLAVLAAAVTALALAACGSDDNSDSSSSSADTSAPAKTAADTAPTGGGAELTLDAVEKGPGQYSFSKKSLTASGGNVTVAMANPAGNQAPHAIEIEGNGVEKSGQVVSAGGTSTVTADLKPGKYEFYCPVDDHRADGMEGTLTVK
jgi:plastocyanin